MKKSITIFVILQFSIFNFQFSNAQTPQAIPYQAIARNNVGNVIANHLISLRFSIRNASALGTVVYRETQTATTNSLGLFTANIGLGTVVTGTFSTINWGNGTKFMQVELDTAGGVAFVDMGTQQMLSVPYALHAASAAGVWNISGNAGTTASNFFGTTDNVALNFKVFNQKAGQISSSSTGNTLFGYQSGNAMTIGNKNTAIGYQTMLLNANGSGNSGFGFNALRDNIDGGDNTAIGTNALLSNTSGGANTAIGVDALKFNTMGIFNTAVGNNALFKNTTGQGNTALGNLAGSETTTGLYNTAIGFRALLGNTTGGTNTAIGASALSANNSSYNSAVGYLALAANTNGFGNTSVGTYSMSTSTTGQLNTAIGGDALKTNVSGSYNTVNGFGAMLFNQTGNENTAIGNQALDNNRSGNRNIAIGYNALSGNDSGSYNIAIGYNANVSLPALTNAIAIGANAVVSSSNAIVLGDFANVGIGTSSPSSKLDIIGAIKITDGTQGISKVLTSDINGLASWQTPVSDNWGAQTVATNTTLSGNGTVGNPLSIAQQAAATGNVLKWNGSSWTPAADNNSGGTVTSITAGTGLSGGTITGSGTISLSSPVVVNNGGTGNTTLATGNFLIGAGTSAVTTTKVAPAGVVVGTTDVQTLTNKTLTSPIISSITNTGTLTLPTTTDVLTGRNTTDVLTNKTLTSNTNNVISKELWTAAGASSVNVVAAAAPTTGQVLTATSATAATWQTPGAASGFTGYETVTASATLASSTAATKYRISVACPAGKKALGGGFRVQQGTANCGITPIESSMYPVVSNVGTIVNLNAVSFATGLGWNAVIEVRSQTCGFTFFVDCTCAIAP